MQPRFLSWKKIVSVGAALALLLIVCAIGFIAWSFVDCPSFSSVFPFLFPPFSCA